MRRRDKAAPPMASTPRYDGQSLKRAILAATVWLEKNAASIDALNVFPVPDGDTGSNMFLTMQAAVKAIATSPEHDASAIARSMAHGALMGARGNSGVILSQILRGLAQGLDARQTVDCEALAAALAQASATAYRGVSKPVEGTMLTVIKEVAEAAQSAATQASDLESFVQTLRTAARASVARTPSLLDVLRQAGVVDAGGQGLYVLLDGILRYMRGELEEAATEELLEGAPRVPKMAGTAEKGLEFGYCTEFLLQGRGLNLDSVREKIGSLGDSALVVGDDNLMRVHVHTFDPGAALSYATSLGILRQVKVDNMQDQHQDFLASFAAPKTTAGSVSTVAVVSGKGLSDVFRSLGATAIVPGGQTMNPSTEEILAAVESVPSDQVILLPNNSNIVFTASQVQSLTTKQVRVIPTETIPQGVASLMALNMEAGFEDNASAMAEARNAVKTIEVTKAIRTANVNGLRISEGQVIGLLDGNLVMADEAFTTVVDHLLGKASAAKSEVITIYSGADAEHSRTEQLVEFVRSKYPSQQVDVVDGGQPHYHYIISVE